MGVRPKDGAKKLATASGEEEVEAPTDTGTMVMKKPAAEVAPTATASATTYRPPTPGEIVYTGQMEPIKRKKADKKAAKAEKTATAAQPTPPAKKTRRPPATQTPDATTSPSPTDVERFKQWKPATIRVKLDRLKEWAKGEGKKIDQKDLEIFH